MNLLLKEGTSYALPKLDRSKGSNSHKGQYVCHGEMTAKDQKSELKWLININN